MERRIGQGGMGVVYVARHKRIAKRFAIKILRVEMIGAPDLTRRFLNEARAASSIGNPHIVDVVDFGQLPDGAPYFVMEHLDGESLASRMGARRGLPFTDVMRITSEIASGLHAAHEAGIVHRDLKPDNVMLQRGGDHPDFVKILDFGIAKVGDDSKRLTMAGSVFGTPHYMSPEQAEGKTVDRRTDIYSLGVMMYEMTAGRVPFHADNFMGILSQHMHTAAAPLRELRSDVPRPLAVIIERCMAKRPRDRYATMAELLSALDLAGRGIVPPPAPSSREVEPAGGHSGVQERRRIPSAVFVVIGVLAFAGVALFAVRAITGRNQVHDTPVPIGAASMMLTQPPPTTTAQVPSPPVPPVTDLRTVTIVANPLDAIIKRDEFEVGLSPKDISIAPGETARITVSKEGFTSRTVMVDGTKPRVEVQLQPKRTGDATAPPQPTSPPTKSKCPPGQRMIRDQCMGL